MKKYKTYRVCADNPGDLNINLSNKIDSLQTFGWKIERIDCHDNIRGYWNGDEKKYEVTKEYIIIAYTEVNEVPLDEQM